MSTQDDGTDVNANDRGLSIVVAAATAWDGVKGTDRHIAEALARRHHVLWVDPPASVLRRHSTRRRLPIPGTDVIDDTARLRRVSVVTTPGVTRPILRDLAAMQLRRAVRRCLPASTAPPDVVLNMGLDEAFTWFPGARKVLYLTDDLPAGSDYLGVSRERLERQERLTLAAADTVLCVSDVLAGRIVASGFAAHVLPNGCDLPPARSAETPRGGALRPRAVLAGNLNQRIDWAAVEAIADSGAELLLVGPLRPDVDPDRFRRLCSRSTVEWVGQVDHPEVVRLLTSSTVGITPYVDNAFNQASFPLKTLEYLAAGLDVVSTDLAAVRWLNTDLIRTASDPHEFAEQVLQCLSTPSSAADRAARRAFAEGHSWDRRASQLLDLAMR